jgi:hypothetical protein
MIAPLVTVFITRIAQSGFDPELPVEKGRVGPLCPGS